MEREIMSTMKVCLLACMMEFVGCGDSGGKPPSDPGTSDLSMSGADPDSGSGGGTGGADMAGGSTTDLAGNGSVDMASGSTTDLAGGSSTDLAGNVSVDMAGGSTTDLDGGSTTDLAGGSTTDLAGGSTTDLAGGSTTDLAGGSTTDLAGTMPDLASGGDVTGTVINTYVSDTGATALSPVSLPSVAALVPTGGGSFATFPGTAKTDGSFTIPNVPNGTFYLSANSGDPANQGYFYVVTTARTIDLGSAVAGRSDRTAAISHPTNVVFNVGGMSAWQNGDLLQFVSSNAGVFANLLGGTNLPTPGATALNMLTVDWFRLYTPWLIDGTKGDRAIITHLSSGKMSGNSVAYSALVDTFQPAAYTQTSGMQTTLNGNFSSVSQSGSYTVPNWLRSQFAALRTAVHPSATLVAADLEVAAHPNGLARGILMSSPALLDVYGNGAAAGSDVNVGATSFGNPFPGTWSWFGAAATTFRVDYTVPGAATPVTFYPTIANYDRADSFAASSIQPLVGPPTNLQINGKPATSALTGVTNAPTVSWNAPSVGAPNGYQVIVYSFYAGGGPPLPIPVASIVTLGTSVTVPPEVMTQSTYRSSNYVIEVTSVAMPAINFATQPLRQQLPYGVADAYTAIFSP